MSFTHSCICRMSDHEKRIEHAKWQISYFESTIGRLEFNLAIALAESPLDVAGSYDTEGIEMKLVRCRAMLIEWKAKLESLEKENAAAQ